MNNNTTIDLIIFLGAFISVTFLLSVIFNKSFRDTCFNINQKDSDISWHGITIKGGLSTLIFFSSIVMILYGVSLKNNTTQISLSEIDFLGNFNDKITAIDSIKNIQKEVEYIKGPNYLVSSVRSLHRDDPISIELRKISRQSDGPWKKPDSTITVVFTVARPSKALPSNAIVGCHDMFGVSYTASISTKSNLYDDFDYTRSIDKITVTHPHRNENNCVRYSLDLGKKYSGYEVPFVHVPCSVMLEFIGEGKMTCDKDQVATWKDSRYQYLLVDLY